MGRTGFRAPDTVHPGIDVNKPHEWVGAFVLPLKEKTARKATRPGRHGVEPFRFGKVLADVEPVLVDIYCEACRRPFGDAPPTCLGNAIYGIKRRKRA